MHELTPSEKLSTGRKPVSGGMQGMGGWGDGGMGKGQAHEDRKVTWQR